jgi:type IV secretion/conjugal transfer VirB4 family ATPase
MDKLQFCLLLTGGLGMAVCVMLFFWARSANRAVPLKIHRDGGPGFCDLLNYGVLIEPGILACKNGALLAAYEYVGEDHSSLSDEQQDLASDQVAQALNRFGSGWMFHIDAVRALDPGYLAQSEFPDPVSRELDAERRRAFEKDALPFRSRYVLALTYHPPGEMARRADRFLYEGEEDPSSDRPLRAAKGHLERFKRELRALEDGLSGVVALRRLANRGGTSRPDEYNELLEHLQFCITGQAQPVRLPKAPVYLDAVLGGQDFYPGISPRVGRNHVICVAIEGFPSASHPGILQSLTELETECRWSTRWIALDPWEALDKLEKYRRKWAMMVLPLVTWIANVQTNAVNKDAGSMEQDATDAKQGISSGRAQAGQYTSVVALYGEDAARLEQTAREIEKQIRRLGFAARVETDNAIQAYLGSLPGHGVENVRRPLLHTRNLADLLPLSSIWTGRKSCPCPFYPKNSPALALTRTTGGAAFYLNLHAGDLGHLLVFGPSKMGKSVLLAFLIISFRRYPRMAIWVFDKGNSFYCLCRALGGRHYDVGADSGKLCFAPLSYLETPSDLAWALSWVELILELNGVEVTPERQNEIAEALQTMAHQGHRSLSNFWSNVQDEKVRACLRQYTTGGAFGHLFDAEEDSLVGFGNLTVFEMEEAFSSLDEKFRLPLLWHLFRRIERCLQGQPAVVVIDEAKNCLDHEAFRKRVEKWMRELRKANCAVILATQGLSDAANSGIFHTLNESTASKVFLPNPAALEPAACELYERFGLGPAQIASIQAARPKRDYFLVHEDGTRWFDLGLSPLALSILAVSDRESVARVRQLVTEHGAQWLPLWLQHKGVQTSVSLG